MSQIIRRIQFCDAIIFSMIAIQMLINYFRTGWTPIDLFPIIGIAMIFVSLNLILNLYHNQILVNTFSFLFDFLQMAVYVYLTIIFCGPFDRILQLFFIILIGLNLYCIMEYLYRGARIVIQIIKRTQKTQERETIRYNKPQRKVGLTFLVILIASSIFTGLSIINFNYTYTLRAADDFNTRSSYWGTPYIDESTQTHAITPIDVDTLYISNVSLGISYPNLRPGALLYVKSVSHSSTPGVNYCNYYAGAKSFPNGTVVLSESLPNLTGVTIEFVYMENPAVFEYLVESNSRIISTNWGNHSWINSVNLFHSISNTYQYLLFEYWNLSYFINIDVLSLSFPHIFNYIPYIERGRATVDWIVNAQPYLAHCIGISYDFEAGNITDSSLSPSRPEMGEVPLPDLMAEKGFLQKNEQYQEILNVVQTAYFNLYDYIDSVNLETYVVYQYWGIQDLLDGDIDLTRLPIWEHPACEYGMMSYQDGKDEDEALRDIYMTNHNQQAIYGDLGFSILTGWLDNADPDYLEYYTNDEAGFNRYIHDVKMHQACGVKEIFHAYLFRLQLKWGDIAIQRLEEALNEDPKTTFTFKAENWNDIETFLFDIVENFNQLIYAAPTLIGIIGILILPIRMKKR